MARFRAGEAPSKFFKFAFCDGLEALSVNAHRTPFPAHFHPTFNITLVYDGTFHTKLADKLILAPSGTILITHPQEIHANPSYKDSSVSFFTFYVSQSFLEYCNHHKAVRFRQNAIDDAALFTSLHLLSVKLTVHSDFQLLEKDLLSVLSDLVSKYGSTRHGPAAREQLLFHEFLAGDDFEKFSLAQTAKRFGLDKYKFIRLFKDQTGLTPGNYFIYRRIEKSKGMLAEGQDLLTVAIDLGFYDAAHYCSHFKKFTGVSPMGYAAAR